MSQTLLTPEQVAKEIAEMLNKMSPEEQVEAIKWLQTTLGGFPPEEDK